MSNLREKETPLIVQLNSMRSYPLESTESRQTQLTKPTTSQPNIVHELNRSNSNQSLRRKIDTIRSSY